MKIISLIVSFITLFSVFSVASPALAAEITDFETSDLHIEENTSEAFSSSPSEAISSGVICDPYIDTAIDPCEYCDSNEYESYGDNPNTRASNPPTESFLDFTVGSLSSNSNDFTQMFDKSIFAKNNESYDTSNDEYIYYVMQGSCTDGEYYYFGYLVKKITLNEQNKVVKKQIGSGILCAQKESDGSYTKIANHRFSEFDLGEHAINHVNDLTYNSDIDKVIAACCVKGLHNKLYLISPDDLQASAPISEADSVYVSCKVASIDYNETRNSYIVGLSGAINKFAILDSDFDVVKVVGFNNYEYEETIDGNDGYTRRWARQSCCADNLRIYSMSFYSDESKSLAHTNENIVRVFDWNGKYIKTIRINVSNGTDRIYESENIFMDGDDVILGFICLRSRETDYYSLNLSELMFHVQYCPDENISEYIGEFDNGNATSLIIRGVETPLLKQRISITGKNFLGWTAYRTEVNKWYYKSADGSSKGWYVAGQQPDGYTKAVYTDKQKVANTGYCGEHILMCAQWEDTNKFYVSFHSGDTPETIYYQEIVYGTATPLRTNTFTKSNRTFQGWHAYWGEKNKWYYKSPDGSSKGWYREGDQPVGYSKTIYSDEQNVTRTATAGGHIQMYPVWDEFIIQYNSNGKVIANSNVFSQMTAHWQAGNTNKLSFFVADNKTYDNNNLPEITGYYLYHKEANKCYYKSPDGSSKGWYVPGQQPAGYTLSIKQKPSSGSAYLGATVPPGQHLVLYALWN